MILYLDTSALVPLIVVEQATRAAGELWDAADGVASARIAYVEAAAALAMAKRLGGVTNAQFATGRRLLDQLWSEMDVVELDEDLVNAAAGLAETHGLRGYDAVHCAAAVSLSDAELVAASEDRGLLRAWQGEGLAIRDTTRD